MRSRFALATIAVLFAGVASASPSGAEGGAGVARRVLDRFAQGRFKSERAGLCVISLDTGEVVAESGSATPLIPASVAKVATAATALDVLGPGYRFETSVDARGTFDGKSGVLEGDLVVHGSGDPGLSKHGKPDDPMHPLRDLAHAVAQKGVRRVTRGVVLDDGAFDRTFLHPGWTKADLEHWYGAPVAGLVFNDACVTVRVLGGEAGDAARVEFPSTAGPWAVDAGVTTIAGGKATVGGRFADSREHGVRLKIDGEVPAKSEVTFEVPVPDPLAQLGAAFVAALSAEGVEVVGGARSASTPADRAPGTRIASHESALAPTIVLMDRHSHNFYASMLFKACGAALEGTGSWESGERAVAQALARRGAFDPGCRVIDGSGLARDSRLTAGAVARLLASFDRDLLRGPLLRDSLAIPGDEEGTMRKRLRDADARARVRVKTGTLGHVGVHALAGYVDGRQGSKGYAFAVLLNASPADGDPLDLLDDVVRELLQG